ncbi:MAG: hypothetical protein AMJ45_00585 [Syntrophobacter sp. DG_60]|nr:MAG: hypothetical protein AMJ45_00585 [Syntrophobacter sp. DG_60]
MKRFFLFLLIFLIASEAKSQTDLPICIQSDAMEAYQEENLIIFKGNVKVKRGEMVIYADLMRINYKQGQMGRRIERIEAEGNVRVVQGEREVIGEKAIFYKDTESIVLLGNPQVKDGRTVIKGGKITAYLEEDKTIIEGDEKEKVEAVIYPVK